MGGVTFYSPVIYTFWEIKALAEEEEAVNRVLRLVHALREPAERRKSTPPQNDHLMV